MSRKVWNGRVALAFFQLGAAMLSCPAASALEAKKEDVATARASDPPHVHDRQQVCANIGASVELARLAQQQKSLAELDERLKARLAELDARRAELAELLGRRDAFERKSADALVAFYSHMKPDAAAAQLAQLDDDDAAALLLRLKPKVSSAILNEIDATRGAALTKRIADRNSARNEKRP